MPIGSVLREGGKIKKLPGGIRATAIQEVIEEKPVHAL